MFKIKVEPKVEFGDVEFQNGLNVIETLVPSKSLGVKKNKPVWSQKIKQTTDSHVRHPFFLLPHPEAAQNQNHQRLFQGHDIHSLKKNNENYLKKKNEKEETVKSFKCSYCHARFKKTKQLINHKCQHPKPQHGTTEERPKKKKRPKMKKTLKCSNCYVKFLSMQSLENHLKLQHAIYINRKFSCFICKKEFSSKELRSQHSQRFHQGGVLQNPGQKCPICKTEFSNFTLLNQHVASKHRPSELRKKLLK